MNLGSIKDKTNERILRKKTVRKIWTAAAVCCLACVAVLSAVAISGKNKTEVPVLEAPTAVSKATPSANTQTSGTVDIPASPTESEASVDAKASAMALPVAGGNVLKGYASDMLLYSGTLKHWSTHEGLDLAANEGAEVFAALDGTVTAIEDDELMGKRITLKHENGCETVYASLGEVSTEIQEGTSVLKGQVIGTAGTSAASESGDGAHLHFEVFMNGKPVNPQTYLAGLSK